LQNKFSILNLIQILNKHSFKIKMQSQPPKKKPHRDLSHSRNLLKTNKPTNINIKRSHSISTKKIVFELEKLVKKPNKLFKKSISKEIVFQTDLKKTHSFEKELNVYNENGSKNNENNKILASQLKRDFEKNMVNDEKLDNERLTYYFRFRFSSLIKGLGFPKYYATKIKLNSSNKIKNGNIIKKVKIHKFFVCF